MLKHTLPIASLAALGILACLAPSASRAAGPPLSTNALTPLLDAAGGTEIGTVGPGVTATVVGTAGDATHVTIAGWSAQGADSIVILAPGKRIVEVSHFTAPAHRTAGAAQTVDGTTYTAVTIDGWVASSALVPDVATVWQSAQALYAQRCSACHALPPESAYNANQWPGVVSGMAANAGLEPAQAALITAYLQAHGAP